MTERIKLAELTRTKRGEEVLYIGQLGELDLIVAKNKDPEGPDLLVFLAARPREGDDPSEGNTAPKGLGSR